MRLLSRIKLSLMVFHARTLSCKVFLSICSSHFDFSNVSGETNSIITPLIKFVKILMIYNPIKEYLSIPQELFTFSIKHLLRHIKLIICVAVCQYEVLALEIKMGN